MSSKPKRNLFLVYGVFPAVAAIIPAMASVLLSIYLGRSQRYESIYDAIKAYPVLDSCKTGTFVIISSIIYVYRYLSILIMLASALSILLAVFRGSIFVGYIAMSSSIFCAPFIALQFPDLIIMSRESVENICAYRNLPVDAVMHLCLIFIASYIIWGNFVISIRSSDDGVAQ